MKRRGMAPLHPLRVARVHRLIARSHRIVQEAIEAHADGHEITGVVTLFSGGNDSTVLAHLMRDISTHAGHANTGIGIEATRQFVRDTCATWNLPLIEKHPPPGSSYREIVLDQGFPGPAHHFKMYQRLKERCLRQVRAELVSNGRTQRVIFLAGRRSDESARRTFRNLPEHEREGSVIWVSPLLPWLKSDLNTYREMYDVPRNEVADLIHMSGECLCGAFAHKGELDEIGEWFPDTRAEIEQLEADVRAAGWQEPSCIWGWGWDAEAKKRRSKSGRLCSSCDARADLAAAV